MAGSASLKAEPSARLEAAYAHCLAVARGHYENFPVASRLLPRAQRVPVAVIYAFARSADDLADEGRQTGAERLARLRRYAAGLDAALAGRAVDNPVLYASAAVIQRHGLPAGLFHDLLTAFMMDAEGHRFDDVEALRRYCRYSANPVGRLMLHLAGQATDRHLVWSDRICTALQLINFLQDLGQDYDELRRIYMPLADMRAQGVDERHFADRVSDDAMRGLLQIQVTRARAWMLEGAPLGASVGGLLGLEIRLIVAGGLLVLDRLQEQREDLFSRPRLTRGDRLLMVYRALRGPRAADLAPATKRG